MYEPIQAPDNVVVFERDNTNSGEDLNGRFNPPRKPRTDRRPLCVM